MKPLRSAVLMITTGVLLASQAGAAFACGQCDPGGAMAAAHAVTAKYHSLNLAKKSAIRSWLTRPESPALPSLRWVQWECTTSKVI
jgi:hypothetical protein